MNTARVRKSETFYGSTASLELPASGRQHCEFPFLMKQWCWSERKSLSANFRTFRVTQRILLTTSFLPVNQTPWKVAL